MATDGLPRQVYSPHKDIFVYWTSFIPKYYMYSEQYQKLELHLENAKHNLDGTFGTIYQSTLYLLKCIKNS